jgi:hypothetical protein
MATPSRMPRYDVRYDSAGPYGVFFCSKCSRDFRSRPDIGNMIAKDIARAMGVGSFLRNLPIIGGAVADNGAGQDPRYVRTLTSQQLDAAFGL